MGDPAERDVRGGLCEWRNIATVPRQYPECSLIVFGSRPPRLESFGTRLPRDHAYSDRKLRIRTQVLSEKMEEVKEPVPQPEAAQAKKKKKKSKKKDAPGQY